MKIERLYSNCQEEERLYSTGNDDLDDLLEKAFCDGYEYAQREFTGEVKRANKAKKREWIRSHGVNSAEYEYATNPIDKERAAIRKGKDRLGIYDPNKPIETGRRVVLDNKGNVIKDEITTEAFGDIFPGKGNVNKNKAGQNITKGKGYFGKKLVNIDAHLRHTPYNNSLQSKRKIVSKLAKLGL